MPMPKAIVATITSTSSLQEGILCIGTWNLIVYSCVVRGGFDTIGAQYLCDVVCGLAVDQQVDDA
jgi:hypothetical protein